MEVKVEMVEIVALFRFVAKNPPTVAMAGGVLLMLVGNVQAGEQAFNTGAILQALWIFAKYVLPRMRP